MEVSYVLQHLDPKDPHLNPTDFAISDAMANYWVNFARNLTPNGDALPRWPAFSDADPQVMYFSRTPHLGPVPSADSLKVLDRYFAWRRTPEGAAWAK
jgi:para-nitrobenzyl esterase